MDGLHLPAGLRRPTEGDHTFRVRATDTAGNTDASPATRTWTIDSSAPVVLTFPAEADATVLGASPSTNFGTTTKLLADLSPVEESLLRFDVQGLGGAVQQATLRLYATNGSGNGPEVYGAANDWQETSVTWDSRPARTSGSVADAAAVPTGSWMELDVTSLVNGNGPVSLNRVPTSNDGTDFSSREAATNRPQLVVTPSGDPDPDPEPGAVVRESVATMESTDPAPSVTVGSPAGAAPGDVRVACVAVNGAWVTGTGTPEGWTRFAAVTAATNPRVYGYHRVVEAGEPASWTWGLSRDAAASVGIARYSGVAAGVLDGGTGTLSGDAATTATLPGVTTTAVGSKLVGCMGVNSSTASVEITEPAGMAPAWDLEGKRQKLADADLGAAGPSGDRTWSFSHSRKWAGWLVALRAS